MHADVPFKNFRPRPSTLEPVAWFFALRLLRTIVERCGRGFEILPISLDDFGRRGNVGVRFAVSLSFCECPGL